MQEIPHLRTLVERHQDDDFALIGINTDEDKKLYNEKAKEHKVNWRSAWEGSPAGPIPTQWQVRSYPTTVVIDRQGIIRYRDARGKALDEAVAKLLAEKPKPAK